MTGLSTYTAQNLLNYVVGKTAVPTLPTAYVALFTVAGADDGTGFTEVTGGSYARVATSGATWNAASAAVPSVVSNALAVAFPTATANWGTVVAWGLYDASTAGNLLAWDYLGAGAWMPFEVSSASPGVLTAVAHGFSAADLLQATAEYGGAFPTFSQSSFTGTLAVVSPTTDTFTVTNSSVAVNTSSSGSGMIRKVVQQSIPSGVQANFAAGALILTGA